MCGQAAENRIIKLNFGFLNLQMTCQDVTSNEKVIPACHINKWPGRLREPGGGIISGNCRNN
jgi:hypothetical protein